MLPYWFRKDGPGAIEPLEAIALPITGQRLAKIERLDRVLPPGETR